MFAPRQIAQDARLSKKQRLVVILMNLLLLVELTVSMYIGQQEPENLTITFLKIFLPLAAITLVASRVLVRRLQVDVPRKPGNTA